MSSGIRLWNQPAHRANARQNALALLVLFLCLIVLLIAADQNRTITAQQLLIRQLFSDSLELKDMKLREVQRKQAPPENLRNKLRPDGCLGTTAHCG
jgi:hypothetical protein